MNGVGDREPPPALIAALVLAALFGLVVGGIGLIAVLLR